MQDAVEVVDPATKKLQAALRALPGKLPGEPESSQPRDRRRSSALLRVAEGRIEAAFERAVWSLRRVPPGRFDWPRGLRCAWPPIVQSTFEAYGAVRARQGLVVPSPNQIEEMDEVLGWLWLIKDPTERSVVWLRACGVHWSDLVARLGQGRTQLLRAQRRGLQAVLVGLLERDRERRRRRR